MRILAALVLVALTLTGCETTQEKAARLERVAKQHEREAAAHGGVESHGLTIARESNKVKVVFTTVLQSSEGTAAVVGLRNASDTALRNVPVAITVKDASGAAVYTNSAPGLSPALVAAPLLPAHGELTWIDDQIQPSGKPAKVSARVGEGEALTSPAPDLSVEEAHLFEDPTNGPGVEGQVANGSSVTQQELVVYALVRRAGRIVAAGRAILPQALANTSTRFQVFFIGSPRGGKLEVSAPPATLG